MGPLGPKALINVSFAQQELSLPPVRVGDWTAEERVRGFQPSSLGAGERLVAMGTGGLALRGLTAAVPQRAAGLSRPRTEPNGTASHRSCEQARAPRQHLTDVCGKQLEEVLLPLGHTLTLGRGKHPNAEAEASSFSQYQQQPGSGLRSCSQRKSNC